MAGLLDALFSCDKMKFKLITNREEFLQMFVKSWDSVRINLFSKNINDQSHLSLKID